MKLRNTEDSKGLQFIRTFYPNCPVVLTKNGTVLVGRVISIDEGEIHVAVTAHESRDIQYHTITEDTAGQLKKSTREEFLLYRLKGWYLSNDII